MSNSYEHTTMCRPEGNIFWPGNSLFCVCMPHTLNEISVNQDDQNFNDKEGT